MTSTVDALRHFAANAPERPAVRTADRQWRYRELHEAAMSFAKAWRSLSGSLLTSAVRSTGAKRAAIVCSFCVSGSVVV